MKHESFSIIFHCDEFIPRSRSIKAKQVIILRLEHLIKYLTQYAHHDLPISRAPQALRLAVASASVFDHIPSFKCPRGQVYIRGKCFKMVRA